MQKMGMKETRRSILHDQLQQIVKILEQLHPTIKVMTDVEKYDETSRTHPHDVRTTSWCYTLQSPAIHLSYSPFITEKGGFIHITQLSSHLNQR